MKLRVSAASGSPETMPSKLYFRIGEVAGLVGVEPHVLRYWEREFRAIRPTKSSKGQRVYSRRDVENLLRVRTLLYEEGFTIAGARKKLSRKPEEGDVAAAPESATPESGERPIDRAAREETSTRGTEYAAAESRAFAGEPTRVSEVSASPTLGAAPLAAPTPVEATASMHAVRASLHELRDELELLLDELGGD
jgi:DNA-binding transcriptional MerR regulator